MVWVFDLCPFVAAYKCACAPGYTLVDGKRCAAGAEAAPQLLMAHEKAVLRMDLHGRAPAPLANATQAAGLDFHYKKNLLFWSDLKTRKVSHCRSLYKLMAILLVVKSFFSIK